MFIVNPLRTWWKARKIFKIPKLKIYCGKWKIGLPIYSKNVLSLIDIYSYDLTWKDKYDIPRFEFPPSINIIIFKSWQILIWLDEDHNYWEQLLWYLYYSGEIPNIDKAKSSWPWVDSENNTTWKDEYIKS